jgi:hypothetical protein
MELNEYDQYGEYFVKAFKDKPDSSYLCYKLDVSIEYANHILNKGGRLNDEDTWYFLKEVEI